MFTSIYPFFKAQKLRFKIFIVLFVLLIFRAIFWYFPINGNRTVSFFSKEIPLSLQSVGSTDYFGMIELQGDPEGFFLAFNSPNSQNFISLDGGDNWVRKDKAGGWSDLLVLSDGDFITVNTTITDTNSPGKIIYRSSKYPEEKKIYQAGFDEYRNPKDIRGVDIEHNKDGLWLLFREGSTGEYVFKLWHSKDGNEWYEEGELKGLTKPSGTHPFSLIVDSEGNIYVALIDSDIEIEKRGIQTFRLPNNYKLTVLKKGKNIDTWEKISGNLGGSGPGRGFESVVPSYSRLFMDEKGNTYILWYHVLSKLESSSPLSPIEYFRYIPVVSLLYSAAALDRVYRDDIYFSVLDKNSNRFSTPRRINDEILSYKSRLIIDQSLDMKRAKEESFKYAVALKSSVSNNGKYLVAAWTDYRDKGRKPIFCSYSNDFGHHWSKSQPVYPNLSDGTLSFDIFVSNNGSLHIIFASKKDNMVYHASGKIE